MVNKEKRAKDNKLYQRKYRDSCKKALFELLGNKCQNCGVSNPILLEIHHPIALKRRNNGAGGDMATYLREYTNGVKLELLCANCHILADIRDNTGRRRNHNE